MTLYTFSNKKEGGGMNKAEICTFAIFKIFLQTDLIF